MMISEGDDHGNPDGFPVWSPLWVTGSWWNVRDLPNIKLLHYNHLKQDLAGNMREIAAFLEIEIDEEQFDDLVGNCSFSAMKQKDNPLGPMGKAVMTDPAQFFFNGQNGRWRDVLSDRDIEEYRALATRYLDEDAIHWMETGECH